jgi:hypothetical protein
MDDLQNGVICLYNDRFEFEMEWTGFDGVTQPVIFQRKSDQAAAGVFQNNTSDITVMVKVTNGCSFNNHYWVWLGGFTNAAWRLEVTDTETGRSHVYTKQLSSTPPQTVKDETSFPCGSLADGPVYGVTEVETMAPPSEDVWGELFEALPEAATDAETPTIGDEAGGAKLMWNCTDDLQHGVVCLFNNRFEFRMTWTGFDGVTQPVIFGRQSSQTAAGVFQNNLSDITLMAKVTNGCSFNNHYWVWLGGFTNAAWRLEVTDTQTGRYHVYTKPLSSTPPQTVKDEISFPCP